VLAKDWGGRESGPKDELRPPPSPPARPYTPNDSNQLLHPDPRGHPRRVFYTKLHITDLLGPVLQAGKPPAPLELRHALVTIERLIEDYVANARLATAA
jgi:hypothetical protein